MALLKLILLAFGLSLVFCVFLPAIIFIMDVIMWHDKEETATQIPSNAPENDERMEVVEDAEKPGEHNTSTFFIPRG